MKIEIDEAKFHEVVATLKQNESNAEKAAKDQEKAGNDGGANFHYGRMVAYRTARRCIEGILA